MDIMKVQFKYKVKANDLSEFYKEFSWHIMNNYCEEMFGDNCYITWIINKGWVFYFKCESDYTLFMLTWG